MVLSVFPSYGIKAVKRSIPFWNCSCQGSAFQPLLKWAMQCHHGPPTFFYYCFCLFFVFCFFVVSFCFFFFLVVCFFFVFIFFFFSFFFLFLWVLHCYKIILTYICNFKLHEVTVSKTSLTHFSLASHKRGIGKQCRSRSDAAERGVWSGSILFVLGTGISIKHGNNANYPETPSIGNRPVKKLR